MEGRLRPLQSLDNKVQVIQILHNRYIFGSLLENPLHLLIQEPNSSQICLATNHFANEVSKKPEYSVNVQT